MYDLTVEKIIEVHDEIILRYDGAQGVLSEATLHFMVFLANRTDDTFKRAAIILHAIGSQHPFMDGNKRTALIVSENVLGQSGFFIAADDDSLVQFMLAVASYTYGPDEIEQWLREHSEAL